MNEALRARLLAMAERDMHMRTELLSGHELFDDYHPRMAAVHGGNAETLEAIIQPEWLAGQIAGWRRRR